MVIRHFIKHGYAADEMRSSNARSLDYDTANEHR